MYKVYSVQSTEFGVATINDSFELNIEIVVDCLNVGRMMTMVFQRN